MIYYQFVGPTHSTMIIPFQKNRFIEILEQTQIPGWDELWRKGYFLVWCDV